MQALKGWVVALVAFVSAFFGTFAHAGVYDTLTAAVSFTDATTAVLAVAAILVGVYVLYRGIDWIIRIVRGRHAA